MDPTRQASTRITIQGHRGARGLYPENSLQGFIEALRLGVDAIELDVVISADDQIVVSHEAWMNEDFCSLPDGSPVKKGTGAHFNLFRMAYSEIKQFDCGKRKNSEFPMQMTLPSHKPLLREVISHVEAHAKQNNLAPVSYNIELKTEPEDGRFNPPPAQFADLVYDEIRKYRLGGRISVSSFDVRLLREMKQRDAALRTGLLVENLDSLEANLESLGFVPATYNPEFVLVNEALVGAVHHYGMQLIPWTVNEKKDMEQMISMGVDGIITDYPDRLIELLKPYKDTF